MRLPALFTTVRYNGNRTYSQRIVHKGTVEELGKISRATRRVFPTAETWLLCSMKVLLRGLNDSVKREANGKWVYSDGFVSRRARTSSPLNSRLRIRPSNVPCTLFVKHEKCKNPINHIRFPQANEVLLKCQNSHIFRLTDQIHLMSLVCGERQERAVRFRCWTLSCQGLPTTLFLFLPSETIGKGISIRWWIMSHRKTMEATRAKIETWRFENKSKQMSSWIKEWSNSGWLY